MSHAPLIRLVPQRHPADCGVAALSMFTGASYEETLLALGGEVPSILKGGVWLAQLQRGAAKLGVTLKPKRQWDADTDEGLAQIRFRKGAHHVLVVRAGLFFDTDFTVWEPDDFLKAKKARCGSLLVRADE